MEAFLGLLIVLAFFVVGETASNVIEVVKHRKKAELVKGAEKITRALRLIIFNALILVVIIGAISTVPHLGLFIGFCMVASFFERLPF
jgi:uncharacterized membrane protein